MSKERPEHDEGTGLLHPDPPKARTSMSGSVRALIVIPPDAKPGDVLDYEFKVDAFRKEGGLLSLQLWKTNERKPTTVKEKLLRVLNQHPEQGNHWKVSTIHQKWLRAISTDDITRAARELAAEGKVSIDINGSRWDSCWFFYPPVADEDADIPIRIDGSSEKSDVLISLSPSPLPSSSPPGWGTTLFENENVVGEHEPQPVRRAKVTWRA